MPAAGSGPAAETGPAIQGLPTPPSLLGESPFWHPEQAALYWCDIPGKALHRWQPQQALHQTWPLPTEPGCAAPMLGGGLLLAMRDGLWRFDPARGERERLAEPPYDPAHERFNDGKADPQGRLWVGTIYEPRDPANAALYRWAAGRLDRMAGDVTVSNGLAWSPDGRTLYWADTQAHRVRAFDFDLALGELSAGRDFAQFEGKPAGGTLEGYAGRPDGAAVDSDGNYWVAMFEGAQLLQFSPDGRRLRSVALPAQCPTMPCFGGADLKTLYVTTARVGRSPDELARLPLSGQVLSLRVEVPGLPVNFAQA